MGTQYPATILQLTHKKYINIYINKDEKRTSLGERISLLTGDVNVLQFMLVYCMFLDEHVNHEPQFISYFRHKLRSQSGEKIMFL